MVKGGGGEAESTRAALLGRYEIGRTLGEGNFAKVKLARHVATGAHFAVKILDRGKILSLKIDDQIKREIGTLKLLKHPNVVRLHEDLWVVVELGGHAGSCMGHDSCAAAAELNFSRVMLVGATFRGLH